MNESINKTTAHDLSGPEREAHKERMQQVVKRFQEYVTAYPSETMYEEYSDDMFIRDMIYGIGIALEPENHKWANGFRKFSENIKNIL